MPSRNCRNIAKKATGIQDSSFSHLHTEATGSRFGSEAAPDHQYRGAPGDGANFRIHCVDLDTHGEDEVNF